MLIFYILIVSLSALLNIHMVQKCKLVLLCFSITILEWVLFYSTLTLCGCDKND